ncbi:DUF1521 domain-containing protein [Pelomonas sp. CA6]|uniref:DUF1521 domain-containing protein n=1 Tax=Pelomonas sp. CA6 TaxID=2907999 RepID=UPI001F4BF27E|nr:DUF1521 domain-containing protein [Pelomonas sp. CA6]MCH7345094.1 DUF1521 domain-containing protein [Pelomonas sp. CA6]
MYNSTTVSASLSASVNLSQTSLPGGVVSTNPTNAHTSMQGGKAVFENDNYRIVAGDNNEINIHNKKTGEDYKIWGDPHVNIDGQHSFDFWGTTTFQLNDGTKLTVQTVDAGNGMTLASKLTITNGDYAAQISGIDTNKVGDLKVDEGLGWGRVLDGAVADGNTLLENATGKGFVAVDGNGQLRQVDQAYINATDLKKGGAALESQQEMAQLMRAAFGMSGLISIVMTGLLLRHMGADDGGSRGGDRVFAGGNNWFNEGGAQLSNSQSSRSQWLTAHVDASFSLTLTRWNG